MMVFMPALRRPPQERLAAWLWTGPLGHLYGGLTDFVLLLARILGGRLRGAFGRPPGSR
ncbi:MAG: hypothetical protein QOG62_59 [Thermoleophilaceae bacterium]|jgi:hypothetical protein|nr:hypothetical protein [Thermoleophilaceae bacterium]